MSERFQTLFRLPANLYMEGSPVLIFAGALLKDTQTGNVLAQLRIKNISAKSICACKVAISAFEANGTEVDGMKEFSYLDLTVKRDTSFGTKTPVYLPVSTTRKIQVSIIEVVFCDGTLWNHAPAKWSALPEQTKIEDYFSDPQLQKQYKLDVGENSSFIPDSVFNIQRCTCGAYNFASEECCHKCGKNFFEIITALDETRLHTNCAERLEAEAAEAKKAALAAQKRKKIRILILSILFVCLIAIVASLVVKNVVLPMLQYNKALTLIENREVALPTLQYNKALTLIENREYDEAEEILLSLGDYKDTQLLLSNIDILRISSASVGDEIYFGSYEQDNNTANGTEPIEWIVLDKQDNQIFAISRYCLDCVQYNNTFEHIIPWADSTLCAWLNNEFITAAFSENEQQSIIKHNSPNKISILSLQEASMYFSSDTVRISQATEYAEYMGAISDSNGNINWLLRNTNDNGRVMYVDSTGKIIQNTVFKVTRCENGIRPAMWIDLSLIEP